MNKFKGKKGNHKIATKKRKRKNVLHRDSYHGPMEPRASVLLMSYANPMICFADIYYFDILLWLKSL